MADVIRVAVRDVDAGEFVVTMIGEIVERAELVDEAVKVIRNLASTATDGHPVVDDTATIIATFAGKVRQAFRELQLAVEIVAEAHEIRY